LKYFVSLGAWIWLHIGLAPIDVLNVLFGSRPSVAARAIAKQPAGPGSEAMYGYRADEAIGQSISMLLPRDRQA
jgi:hypothetical protein